MKTYKKVSNVLVAFGVMCFASTASALSISLF